MPITLNGDLKKRLSDLWTIWIVASALPIVLFLFAAVFYSLPNSFDRSNRTLFGGEVVWLWLLLGLPLIIQIATMCSLLRLAQRYAAVTSFYRLCLIVMSVGSSGYCLMWLFYTVGWQDIWPLSIVALGLIVVLVLLVSFVTYLIMWSPRSLPEARLTEDDIRSERGAVCSRLYNAQQSGEPAYLANVFNVLNAEAQATVIKAVTLGEFDEVNVSAIVKCLNQNVIEGKFFMVPEVDKIPAPRTLEMWHELNDVPRNSTNLEQRNRSKLVNRLLLDACLNGKDTSPLPDVLTSKWNRFCRKLKPGLGHAPFEVLIFFFTIFLAISYLFAFAFAFDDKAHLVSTKQPALLMRRTHASAGINNRIDITDDRSVARVAPWPPYLLYVSNDGSSFSSESKNFDMDKFDEDLATRTQLVKASLKLKKDEETYLSQSRASAGSKVKIDRDRQYSTGKLQETRQNIVNNIADLAAIDSKLEKQIEAWKMNRNHDHILRLIRSLEDEASQNRGIVLDLTNVSQNPRGQKTPPAGRKTPSPAALPVNTEFVSQNIYYLLNQKLVENSANLNNIDWFHPPEQDSRRQSNSSPVLSEPTNTNWEALVADASLVQPSDKNKALQHEIERLDGLKDNMSSVDNKILTDRFTEITKIVQQRELREEQQVYQDKLDDSLMMLRVFRQSIELRGVNGWTDHTIAVSVKAMSDKNSSIPLSLMDYMYFTIYTITTTGYGDIVPTTTYAKFLCTFANILEVFFFVVFFNALLSAKKRYRPVT
jgi:hypothetical protein